MRAKTHVNNKINVITLGCSKNVYDSEILLGQLKANNLDVSHTKNEIASWLTSNIDFKDKIKLFATGGNINKIQSMSGTKNGKPISYISVKDLLNKMIECDFKERMIKFNLNPDRADVIIPALEIFILTMESAKANKMFIPKTGLVDGMIKETFFERNGNKLNP